MNLYMIMKFLHILAAFLFIGGLLGRDIAFWRAGRVKDVHAVSGLLGLSDYEESFEHLLLISAA